MNNNESLHHIRVGFDRMNQLLEANKLDLNELADLVSGTVHLNDPENLTLSYLDKNVLEKIGMPIETINAQGFDFLKTVIEPENLVYLLSVLNTYKQRNDQDTPVLFFQNYRFDEKEEYHWHATMMKYNKRLDQLFCIDFDLRQFNGYAAKIKRIAEEDNFRVKHFSQYYSLTKREKEILKFIALGESNQQISEHLFLSKDTIRTHRNNIWQKLGIKGLVDAIRYAQAFDLI